MPLSFAKIIAFLFERFPKPLITQDQLRLLKYDNILSEKNKSNIDIGFEAKLKFDQEIRKYSYMWKKGGEYSR
jgi:NADH dehydrogenase